MTEIAAPLARLYLLAAPEERRGGELGGVTDAGVPAASCTGDTGTTAPDAPSWTTNWGPFVIAGSRLSWRRFGSER